MSIMIQCLYCPSSADSKEEHVLPVAFGEFVGAHVLENRVCTSCNNTRLGLLDEQLARCGPEAFFRKWYGVVGRQRDQKVNPFYRGSAGGHRQELTAWDSNFGVEVNLEVLNGQARQLHELIFIETSGKTHHLPIREGMTSNNLQCAFKALNVSKPFEARLSCDPGEKIWIEPLLKQVWPLIQFGESIEGSKVFHGASGKIQLTDRYFRAFAKIGFHYFLSQFPSYSGHEPIFSDIRKFVSEESATPVARVNKFVGLRQRPLLGEMLNPNARPDGWRAHLVCAEVLPGLCLAHIQMFLTEDWPAPTYTIRLASDSSIVGTDATGHIYFYYPDGPKGRYSGEVDRLRTTRADFPPLPVAPAIASV